MGKVRALGLAASVLLVTAGLASAGPAAHSAPPGQPSASEVAVAAPGSVSAASSRHNHRRRQPKVLGYKHVVVIYQENHSFDNLYGRWGRVAGHKVDGLKAADASHTIQLAQDGRPYACLPQNDVNLTSPPQPDRCTDAQHGIDKSDFQNKPFS